MKLALRLLVRIVALPLVLVVLGVGWLMRRYVRFRVVVMEPRFFGHLALEPEVFINEGRVVSNTRPREVLRCTLGKASRASNIGLWKLRHKSLPTFPSWIVTAIQYWQSILKASVIEIVSADYHRLNFLKTTEVTLPSGGCFEQRRGEILQRFKEPHRPYVIFTVRDVDSDQDLRNREIRDFEPAMLALTDYGFNVIRLTSKTHDRISAFDQNILDFQTQIDGRELDELALVSNASFIVSSTTGIDCLALAYRRPVLYIDAARFFYMFLGTELATIHMPRFVSVESEKLITLAELLELDLGWVKHSSSFFENGVKVLNSSPEEIQACVTQYAQAHLQPIKANSASLQDQWRSQLLDRHAEQIDSRHGDIRALFSDWFLENRGYEFVTGNSR